MASSTELTSLRSHVRTCIVNGISDGSLCPGDKISEQSIADSLGVSRTPTREALLQLNSEGLLDYIPRRGFSIKLMTAKEKEDTYELVAVMDAYCALCAVAHIDAADISAMKETIDKIDISIKYQNTDDYRELQHIFHCIYRKKCGNALIMNILDNSESGIAPQTFMSDNLDELMELYYMLNNEHREIVSLFEKKDAHALFEYLLETHWSLRYLQMTEFAKKQNQSNKSKRKDT
ncbi:MAG: GntR family transcriptional regulator [Oscillospiraceae bacterium]